jgi:hypothetical protein
MRLDNGTPYTARIVRRVMVREVHATLVVKATFERATSGKLVQAGEQIPFFDAPFETPFGVFNGEQFGRKDGVDLCVLGTLRPPSKVREARVTLACEPLSNELVVLGDRRWIARGAELAPSPPEPFDELPLAYTRAYGGTTRHDDETYVYQDNPVGRGYYMSEQAAMGQPLPNIESSGAPQIREWTDRPTPAGWAPYPFFWGLRAREGVQVPAEAKASDGPLPRVMARLNNNAHPALVVARVAPGSVLRIHGMRPRQIAFELPRVRPVAEIAVGGHVSEAEAQIDGIVVWADVDRVTLTLRAQFNYLYRDAEERVVRLRDAARST